MRKIANEFVSEAAAAEVASAGLNAIREVCARQPLAMEDTLLQDLVLYRKSKDKGVMMAAKGLLSLYRNVGAELLSKRDRGKTAALAMRTGDGALPRFGEVHADDGIAGIELLEEWKREERRRKRAEAGLPSDDEGFSEDEEALEREEADGWKNWDVEENDSDGSGGWIDVVSDGEEINLSDSDDEKPPKKAKTERATSTPAADVGTPASIASTNVTKKSNLATTRILTPADLLKLKELQQKSAIITTMNKKTHHSLAAASSVAPTRSADDEVTAANIEGLAMLSHKDTKAEKIAKAKGEDREKHVSSAALRKEKKIAEGKSTTNKEKARLKNFHMTLGKAKRKSKRSMRDVRAVLKGHAHRSKHGGKRGNQGQ